MSAYAQQASISMDGSEDQGENASDRDDSLQEDTLQNDVLERLKDAGEQVSEFVRERPLVAVGVAAATGFLLARLFHR